MVAVSGWRIRLQSGFTATRGTADAKQNSFEGPTDCHARES
jgi:hypothetical protein